jgi:hypothetical protein
MPNTFEALADLEGWEDAEITAFGIIKEIAALPLSDEHAALPDGTRSAYPRHCHPKETARMLDRYIAEARMALDLPNKRPGMAALSRYEVRPRGTSKWRVYPVHGHAFLAEFRTREEAEASARRLESAHG